MIANEVQFADVAQAVEKGFAQVPKRLPSWLFYDETGDKIFQEIMHMPEYYLTRAEYEILEAHKSELLKYFEADGSAFNLVELGAGDGLKTEI
jgi:L-histidine Nalpha-methyltransferase